MYFSVELWAKKTRLEDEDEVNHIIRLFFNKNIQSSL